MRYACGRTVSAVRPRSIFGFKRTLLSVDANVPANVLQGNDEVGLLRAGVVH